jgi:hypothetical protein
MDKYHKKMMAYANNRKRLLDVHKQIDELIGFDDRGNKSIDISKFRDDYFHPDEFGNCGEVWKGWVYCLKFLGDVYNDDELHLAILLDKKKEIIREAGQIKRDIATMGRALLNKQVKEDDRD